MSQRNVALWGIGLALVGVIGWRMIGDPHALVVPLGSGNPLGGLAAYAAPRDSAPGFSGVAPGQSILLSRDPFTASVVYHPATRQVPMRTRPDDAGRAEVWRVTAVLITSARRAAVVNDSLVDQGGTLPGGARLTSVEADRVVVTDARGGRHVITARDEGAGGEESSR